MSARRASFALLATAVVCGAAARLVAQVGPEQRDHGRAQRAARIARFHALWDAAEVGARDEAAALLRRLAGGADIAGAWPSDLALCAASDLLRGTVGEEPPAPGSLRDVAQALELAFAPGWVEPVPLSEQATLGAAEAFTARVTLMRPVAVPEGVRVNLLAPRLGRSLRAETAAPDVFHGAGFELFARLPVETGEALELVVELERSIDDKVERARSLPFVLPVLDSARERVSKLRAVGPDVGVRVDVAAARGALELLGATGLLAGVTRDPLALIGALEFNAQIAASDDASAFGVRNGLRLCGPLRLGADAKRRWVGWQAGPSIERIVWFWSSEAQPWDAAFLGGDALALEWQRLGSGHAWLFVACEPETAPVDDLRSAQAELRAAFPALPIALVARGDAVARLTLAALGGAQLQVDELVLVSSAPSTSPLLPALPTLHVAAPPSAAAGDAPRHVSRVNGAASPFLTDPALPRLYEEWRARRGKP